MVFLLARLLPIVYLKFLLFVGICSAILAITFPCFSFEIAISCHIFPHFFASYGPSYQSLCVSKLPGSVVIWKFSGILKCATFKERASMRRQLTVTQIKTETTTAMPMQTHIIESKATSVDSMLWFYMSRSATLDEQIPIMLLLSILLVSVTKLLVIFLSFKILITPSAALFTGLALEIFFMETLK